MPIPKSRLIIGRHPVVDALHSGKAIEKILVQKNIEIPFLAELRKLTRGKDAFIQLVPKEKLNRISANNHQGVIAIGALIDYQNIEDIISLVFEQGKTPLIILLDGVTDIRNFGAIARSAECMGAHAILVAHKGAAAINEISMKTSAGALSRIPVCKFKSLADCLKILKNYGLTISASALQGSSDLHEVDLTLPSAIIIGAEDTGISAVSIKGANVLFKIPQIGHSDSLNVSVATGIILYEIQRQRSGMRP